MLISTCLCMPAYRYKYLTDGPGLFDYPKHGGFGHKQTCFPSPFLFVFQFGEYP